MKGADKLILATDPDREGEAISWHILEVLKREEAAGQGRAGRAGGVQRHHQVRRHSKPSRIRARSTRNWSTPIWRAARWTIWSASRSRRCCGASCRARARPAACRAWRCAWSWSANRKSRPSRPRNIGASTPTCPRQAGNFAARLIQLDGKKLEKLSLSNEADADRAVAAIKAQSFSVGSVEAKPVKRNPSPPFITSTLQQEASRKLGFNAKRTMQIAQGLYEGVDIGGETVGLITYMRTDGITMVPEAITEAREVIGKKYGARYVPSAPARLCQQGNTNAQEAHEAIRPTSFARTPDEVARYLDADAARLYELIWKRAVASQMESAEQERTTVDVVSADKQITLRATGTVTLFDGFLTLYQEGQDDEADEDGSACPSWRPATPPRSRRSSRHSISPSRRRAIPKPAWCKQAGRAGHRPSLDLCLDPLHLARPRLCAAWTATASFPKTRAGWSPPSCNSFFQRYVEYDFTADLEEKLDEVSAGKLDWKQLLRDFWKDFSAAVGETKDLKITQVIDELDSVLAPHIFPHGDDGVDPRKCPTCDNGRLNLKLGRFGAFVGCSNYPECKFTRQIGAKPGEGDAGPVELGAVPRYRREDHPAHRPLRALCAAAAKATSPSAAAFPRAPTRPMSIWRWRSSCCRCRARSGCIPKTARRSPPISAASGPMSRMTASMPRWTRPRTCSRSASTTPSPCSPKRRPRARAGAARRR